MGSLTRREVADLAREAGYIDQSEARVVVVPPSVTDDMVEVAVRAYDEWYDEYHHTTGWDRHDGIRAALEAAMAKARGE